MASAIGFIAAWEHVQYRYGGRCLSDGIGHRLHCGHYPNSQVESPLILSPMASAIGFIAACGPLVSMRPARVVSPMASAIGFIAAADQ